MADVFDKIEMLKKIRKDEGKYLPLVDHAWKVFRKVDRGDDGLDDPVYNLGWDTGLLGDDRPYFMECWATGGITMLTYFLSTTGIENASTPDLLKVLTDKGLFRLYDPEKPRTAVMKFDDSYGNEFFSVNVTVGVEDETYLDGGRMYPFAPLNEFNRKRKTKE